MLCVACEESRCKTSHEDLPSKQTLRLYLPTNEHMWPLGFKKGTPDCPKHPQTPNILTDSRSVKDKLPTENPRTDSSPLSCLRFYSWYWSGCLFFPELACDVDIAQWYWTHPPFKCTAVDSWCWPITLISFFFLFFCPIFLAIQKIIALCLYHFTRYMRIYRTIKLYFNDFCFCKIHTNSASSENLCCSSILRFSMFSFSVAESSLTYIF